MFLLVSGAWFVWWPTYVVTIAPTQSATDSTQTYHDTYYVYAHGHYALTLGFVYLMASAITLLIVRLGSRWTRQAMEGAVALFHLATGVGVTYAFWVPLLMPRRYVDYPRNMFWINQVLWGSSMLAFLAACTVLLFLLVALAQTYLRRSR